MKNGMELSFQGTPDQIEGAQIGLQLGAEQLRWILAGLASKVTQLPTRQYFETEVAMIRRKLQREFGIVFFDLDGLKRVNDTLGHGAGDDLLRYFSDALRDKFFRRGSDALCHYGGDEFVVFTGFRSNLEEYESRAQATRKYFIAEAKQFGINVDVSYGIAYGTLESDLWKVVEEADQNMYKMKRTRKTIRGKLAMILRAFCRFLSGLPTMP